jgi:hypothetical protein
MRNDGTVTVEITGVAPLLMHRYIPGTSEKSQPGKRRVKDATYWKEIENEWRNGAYWNDELGLYIPSMNIEACFKEAGRKVSAGKGNATMGKAIEGGFFIDASKVQLIPPEPIKDLDEIETKDWILCVGCRVPPRTGARVDRRRVMIPPGWKLKFEATVDPDQVNPQAFEAAAEKAGKVGIGDWRPKFGRFEAVVRWK